MHNGTNPFPRQWVSNQTGSLSFDVMPLINFIEKDPVQQKYLHEDISELCDRLSLFLAEEKDYDPFLNKGKDILCLFMVVRDMLKTLKTEGYGK
jgi:hypothetical protein